MKILHAPYFPIKLGVEVASGETIMLFEAEERPIVSDIVTGLLSLLGPDDHVERNTLMEVYEHVRAREGKEVN